MTTGLPTSVQVDGVSMKIACGVSGGAGVGLDATWAGGAVGCAVACCAPAWPNTTVGWSTRAVAAGAAACAQATTTSVVKSRSANQLLACATEDRNLRMAA